MCNVMGTEIIYDPDPTYELTADNVKKMLAIYMRFRLVVGLVLILVLVPSQLVTRFLYTSFFNCK